MVYENRTYLDYNATAPILPEVLEEIKGGHWPMGNPSSVHTCGKKAKRKMGEVSDFLYKTFDLKEREFDLFFHSGATEGINTIIKSFVLHAKESHRQGLFLYAISDHSCVVNQVDFINLQEQKATSYSVNKVGEIDVDAIDNILSAIDFATTDVLLNWTWVNNETGVVNPLEKANQLKKTFPQLKIHVDAVQSIGKIKEFTQLSPLIDSYTFSAHKFGALKGTGFTFVRQNMLKALINGGGQQDKLRSGTENTWGVYSIKSALAVILDRYNFEAQNEAKQYIENKLSELIVDKGEIAGLGASARNGNTIYFILNNVKAQSLAMALDMGGIDVSNGSACSSGAVIPSRVLLGMGFSEDQAISAIRLSFGAFFKIEEAIELWPRLENIIKRFLK